MIDSELTKRFQPTQRESFHVVPIQREVWVLWNDDEIEGPLACVAVGTTVLLHEIRGEVDDGDRGKSDGPRATWPIYADAGHANFEEIEMTRFLVLPDNAADWESLWVAQSLVYFSPAAADAAVSERREKSRRNEGV